MPLAFRGTESSFSAQKKRRLVSTHLKNMRKSNWIISPRFRGENKKTPPRNPWHLLLLRLDLFGASFDLLSRGCQGLGAESVFYSLGFIPKNPQKTVEQLPSGKLT